MTRNNEVREAKNQAPIAVDEERLQGLAIPSTSKHRTRALLPMPGLSLLERLSGLF